MTVRLSLITCLICVSALGQAETNCVQRLIVQRLNNTIEIGSPIDGMRSVTILTDSGETVSCPPLSTHLKRQMSRHFHTLETEKSLSMDQLIGFAHAPWAPLSISAGRELNRRARYDSAVLQEQQLDRLTEALMTNQLSPIGIQLTIRLLSLQGETQATPYLSRLLLNSANLSVQRAAARVLGKLNTDSARMALTKCVEEKNRLLSARCARSLVRWRTQHKMSLPHLKND
ncbi:MAG: HEAT repeat domain-containing protein [Bradymonadia bacterium]